MRNSKMDHIKALLICMVVFGHVLELNLDYGMNRLLYLIIYSFHMPMFIYVSGYFASFQWKRLLQKIVWPYVVFQTLYLLFSKYVLEKPVAIQWSEPYWILWYLFALVLWLCTLPLIRKIRGKYTYIFIAIAVIMAIMVGYNEEIGRAYSLSRAVVFYPFFLLGYYDGNPSHEKAKIAKKQQSIYNSVWIGILCVAFLLALLYYKEIGVYWMYAASSYKKDGITLWYRIGHMLVAWSWIGLIQMKISDKNHFYIRKIGENTMPIYLMHGFVIKWMDKYHVFQNISFQFVMCILTTISLVFLFGSPFFEKIFSFFLFGKKGNQQK